LPLRGLTEPTEERSLFNNCDWMDIQDIPTRIFLAWLVLLRFGTRNFLTKFCILWTKDATWVNP
jgi:hypothetical protein